MKRLLLLITGCMVLLTSHAIDIDYSNNGTIAAGLRLGTSFSPSIDAEIDLEYRPFRYVGANVGFLLITPFNNRDDVVEDIPIVDGQYKELKNYKDCCHRTVVKAGVQFTTPAVMLSKEEMGLSLRLSPGIFMPFPTNKRLKVLSGELFEDFYIEEGEEAEDFVILDKEEYYDNSGAKFCYWYGRAEIVLEYEENWEFAIGYTYSNFDLYAGARSIEVNGTKLVLKEKKPFQSITLGFTYKF